MGSMRCRLLPWLSMLVALALGTLALAACGSSGANATPTGNPPGTPVPYSSPTPHAAGTVVSGTPGASGIEGQVLLGPTCPVERPDSPCPPRPGAHLAVQVYAGAESGMYVANILTDDQGRFRVDLDPGRYTIDGPCSGATKCIVAYPRLAPTTVIVNRGTYSQVTVHGDTGIR